MTSAKEEKIGWGALLSGKNGLKSIALAGGVMLHATDVYLATTIMPSVTKDIGGLSFYSWATTMYVVAAIIGSVISSVTLAKIGPRAAYRMAIVLFSAGALLCALAPAMYVLLAGRFIQGIGGGLLVALSYAMISIVYEKPFWSRAMALVSAMWGVSAFLGPFFGGIFAEYSHWRYAFVTLLVIALLLIVLTENILPKKQDKVLTSAALPLYKLVLILLAALAISTGSVSAHLWANASGVVVAIILLSVVISSEKGPSERLLPRGAYQISTLLGATYAVVVLLTLSGTVEIYIPYFLQLIHGFSPLQAGYLTVLIALGWSLCSIAFSGLPHKYVRAVIICGPLFVLAGLLGLAFMVPEPVYGSGTGFVLICLLLVFIGAGIGMGWSHILTQVLSSASKGEEEKASASISTVQLLGTAFGSAIAGLVANFSGITSPGGIPGAQNAAFWLFSVFALTPLLALMVILFKFKKRPAK
jgi:MFS family permease